MARDTGGLLVSTTGSRPTVRCTFTARGLIGSQRSLVYVPVGVTGSLSVLPNASCVSGALEAARCRNMERMYDGVCSMPRWLALLFDGGDQGVKVGDGGFFCSKTARARGVCKYATRGSAGSRRPPTARMRGDVFGDDDAEGTHLWPLAAPWPYCMRGCAVATERQARGEATLPELRRVRVRPDETRRVGERGMAEWCHASGPLRGPGEALRAGTDEKVCGRPRQTLSCLWKSTSSSGGWGRKNWPFAGSSPAGRPGPWLRNSQLHTLLAQEQCVVGVTRSVGARNLPMSNGTVTRHHPQTVPTCTNAAGARAR